MILFLDIQSNNGDCVKSLGDKTADAKGNIIYIKMIYNTICSCAYILLMIVVGDNSVSTINVILDESLEKPTEENYTNQQSKFNFLLLFFISNISI